MSTRFHLRARRILEIAVQAEPEARESLIQEACADDARLLEEVRSLLPHYQTAGKYEPGRPLGSAWGLPGTTTFTHAADAAADEPEWAPPFAIAPYTVVAVLGRGGMGVVYRAVHPTKHRVVAIKVLRRRLRSREDRRRFMFEEEILRQLRHPGIGRFLHGGIARVVHRQAPAASPDRRPYFVMEYVAGQSLTKFAEAHELDVRARLALFARVCEALEYAHRRGIIHRDLKPDNILVEESGQPKVLDFGIAHILAFDSALIRNEDGQFAGTLEYASPEQRAGHVRSLSPSSDAYTLALIAHELLTGRLPRRVGGTVRLDLKGVILDDNPSRQGVNDEFRYYLTVILATALRKTRGAQYRHAGELQADVESLLNHYPAGSAWTQLKGRLSQLVSPRLQSGPHFASRPLSAVLRKRIAMAVESEDFRSSKLE